MSAPSVAFLFPGQGSQSVGMGRLMAEAFSQARDVFREADECLGFPLSAICFEGPEEKLRLTELTQPAILATSIACDRVLGVKDLRPTWVAGHSLGEYSALVSAGSLRLADAVGLVHRRGRYMQEVVPVGEGAMAAVLGLPPEAVERLCRDEAKGEILSAANFNSPEQTVIAGTSPAVERAVKVALGRGARRATGPVRWEASMREMARLGAVRFVEVGPGRVLSGLLRRILPEARIYNVEDPPSLERTLRLLEQEGP